MNSRTLSAGVLSAAILLSVLLLRLMLLPSWFQFRDGCRELARCRSLTSEARDYDNLRKELSRTGEQLKAKLDDLSSGLGYTGDLSGLLQMLIGKAREADIRFVRMEPQPQTTAADFIRYPVVLEMNTTYHSLGRFISSLEAAPSSVRVNRLALSAAGNAGLSVRLLVTCYLHTDTENP